MPAAAPSKQCATHLDKHSSGSEQHLIGPLCAPLRIHTLNIADPELGVVGAGHYTALVDVDGLQKVVTKAQWITNAPC